MQASIISLVPWTLLLLSLLSAGLGLISFFAWRNPDTRLKLFAIDGTITYFLASALLAFFAYTLPGIGGSQFIN
jgi:hypothetical protein